MTDPTTRRELLGLAGTGVGIASLGGLGTAAAQSGDDRKLTVESVGPGTTAYQFEVRNDVSGTTNPPYWFGFSDYVRTTDAGTTVFGGSVTADGEDGYEYTEELDIVRFGATGDLDVAKGRTFFDRTYFDPATEVERHTLLLGSTDPNETVEFEFEVESGLERSDAFVSNQYGDTVSGNVATGAVGGIDVWRDRKTYEYDGDLVRLTAVGGDIVAILDGRQVTPGAVVQDHTLTIDGTAGSEGETTIYEFEVERDLRKADVPGSSRNDGDDVDGTVARGNVVDHRDSYVYGGDLLRFDRFGDAQVILDGRAVDLTRTRLNLTGTGRPTPYEFEVKSGVPGVATGLRKVAPSSAEPTDTVDGAEATGIVVSGTDAYEFVGDLARFTADGDLGVQLDGEEIRPRDVVEEHTVTYIKGGSPQGTEELKYRIEIEEAGTLRLDDALNAKTTDRELNGHVPGGEGVGKVRENFARGAVLGNRDSYVFTGEVVWSEAGDAVEIILDGEEVTAEELAKQ